MQFGIFVQGSDVDDLTAKFRSVAEAGFPAAWTPQIFGIDAMTAIALAAREIPDIRLGTAVVATYPRHPMALAAQALTVQQATGGRFHLGIGLSHQIVVEGMLGMSFAHPATHMEEYLAVLMPLLHTGAVTHAGTEFSVNMTLDIAAPAPPVLVAALGSRMLKIAGTQADGTVTWMTGPATVRDHIVPTIRAAAAAAGRPDPRVVVALPVSVTDDEDGAREAGARLFAAYGYLPSYRAMLDREGADGPADVAIVGSEDEVAKAIGALAEHGTSEFVAVPFEERTHARTLELLTSLM
jgi:5,10-methylenetetrahydromethanopterin reductase